MFKKIALSIVFATMLTLSLFNSQATAASTVSFCIEVSCSSMTVVFGGVTHPKTLNCENMLSFDGASAGTYSYSISGCGLTASGSVTVDGTSSYTRTICPPSGWPCCPIGCGAEGDYKCSCSGLTAPTLNVTTSGTTISLSWASVAGATGYTLYYAPYPKASPIGNIPMGNKTSISFTLPDGAAFYVAVQAHDSAGSSGYSNIEHFIISESEFTVMTNPTDGQILSVKGSDGTTIHYYGDRNENGIPTNIDRFLVVDADGATTAIELNSEDRPKRIVTPEGVVFEISYIGSNQGFVTAISPDGSIQVNTSFPIETGAGNPSSVESMASISANNNTGECLIRVDRCGAGATDATVFVRLFEAGSLTASHSTTAIHVKDGLYSVSLPTSLKPALNAEDLRQAALNIAGKLGSICTALSLTQSGDAFLLLAGMCPQLGLYAGLGAPVVTAGCATAIAAVAAYCNVLGEGFVDGEDSVAEKVLKALQDPKVLTGEITIEAHVSPSWAMGLGATATATASAAGPFPDIDLAVSTFLARITHLTISPTNPVAREPYEIITEITCPHDGDYLVIDVIRIDDITDDSDTPIKYHFQLPPIYGGITTSLTRAIPAGGGSGAATDTITATVYDKGDWPVLGATRTTIIKIPAAVPTITAISPKSGVPTTYNQETIVTITGSAFGKTRGSGYVLFNGSRPLEYGSWTDTEIKTVVPFDATSGNVIVYNEAGNSNGVYFEVKTSEDGCPTFVYDESFDYDGNYKFNINIADKDKDGYYEDRYECTYYESGQLWIDSTIMDDRLNGTQKRFFESGSLEWNVPYTNGKINGDKQWYYETGILHVYTPYVDDIPHGDTKWYYESGKLYEVDPFINGKVTGTVKRYYESGVLLWQCPYVNDEKNGMEVEYDESGNQINCWEWENGNYIGPCHYEGTV